MERTILCRFCKRDITKELASYGGCEICKKAILFECEGCHRSVVHKDYVPQEVRVNVTKPDLSSDSHARDATNAIKQARRAKHLPWWNYYE